MSDSRLHALLAPSSASRWTVCTPSARLEEQYPDSEGDAAREGTLAHAISELMLRYALKHLTTDQYKAQLDALIASDVIVDDDLNMKQEFYCASMHEYCEQYVTFVLEQWATARKHTPDAKLYVEQRLDLSAYIPESFGTGDAGIVANDVLRVIDLKYGKGVEVSAIDNTQMKVYALGWLAEHGMLYDIKTVQVTIFQPRIDNYSTWEISVADLMQWAEDVLRPKAIQAFAGEGDFVPGKHCQFCRVKLCKARADYQLELAKYEFAEPAILSDSEVSEILDRSPDLIKWANMIQEYALHQAVHKNKQWPGFKLIMGRSNRSYVSDARIIKALVSEGIPEDKLYKPKELLGVTAMEEMLGKKTFNSYLHGLIVKPPGKLALVPQEDKRPAFNSLGTAEKDFDDELDPMLR
jgi:hypothetical protein